MKFENMFKPIQIGPMTVKSFHPAAECRAGRKCKECRRANPGGNSHPIYGRKRHAGRSAYRAGI